MGAQTGDGGPVSAPEPVVVSRGPLSAEVSSTDVQELGPEASTWRSRRARWKAVFCKVVCSPGTWPQRILCLVFWLMVIALIVAVFAVLLPKALGRPIQRLIQILQRSLTRGQLIAIVMGAVVVLPCTLIFPMMPFIWIAGIALDFGTAFGIVMVASVVGMSLQYWAARYLFKDKVERHLLQRRKDGISVALRAVDIAGPWKVVALIRLGPSPYAAMNYIFGVCPTIRYHQYIIASTVCTAHHRALSVFFGRAMPTLADLFSGKPVDDVGAAVYRFVLLALGIALVVFIVILAKKALKSITDQELAREKAEAETAAAAAAAEAAEDGTAGEQHQEQKTPDCVNGHGQKVPLPLAVDSKLAAAAAAPTSCGASGSSVGDLQVIVADDTGVHSQDSSLSMSRGSNNSLIATAPVPPAAADDQAGSSMSSRTSSISSMMGLLSARFQRSS